MNPKVSACNAWRFDHVVKLFNGIFYYDSDKMVQNAVNCLSIRTGSPSEYGYSADDIRFYRDKAIVKPFLRSPVTVELNGDGKSWRGLRSILEYKKTQLQKLNKKVSESGGAGNNVRDQNTKVDLILDIKKLGIKINMLARIETIFNDQLKARETVEAPKAVVEAPKAVEVPKVVEAPEVKAIQEPESLPLRAYKPKSKHIKRESKARDEMTFPGFDALDWAINQRNLLNSVPETLRRC